MPDPPSPAAFIQGPLLSKATQFLFSEGGRLNGDPVPAPLAFTVSYTRDFPPPRFPPRPSSLCPLTDCLPEPAPRCSLKI